MRLRFLLAATVLGGAGCGGEVDVTNRPAALLIPSGSRLDLELTEPLIPVPR
jgi:hypothetical protein